MSSSANSPSLEKLARQGAIWTVGAFGASSLLRFGSNLILTRLLIPELFGLMSLTYVFIAGLQMFSDVGVGLSIIRHKRGDEREFLNTAWTIQVIRGMVLWIACLLLAYPAAQIYQEPRLLWLVPIVGLNTVLAGFNSTAIYTLNRRLAVKEAAFFELSGQLVTTVVIISWALVQPSIWALVAGGLAAIVYQLILSHWLSYWVRKGETNWFGWEKSAAREILSFGAWIFFSTGVTFFAEQVDKLILGKLLGLTLLGVYGVALTFADLPRSVTLALCGKVILPALSMIADQPRPSVRARLARKRRPLLVVLAVSLALLAAYGDLIIKMLYDSRYQQAAWMLPLLTVGIWPRLLCSTIEPFLTAIGRPQYIAFANLSRFICTVVGIWVGYSLFQVPGAVMGVVLNDLCYYCVIAYGLVRERFSAFKDDAMATGLFVCVLALLVILRYAFGFGTPIDTMLVG